MNDGKLGSVKCTVPLKKIEQPNMVTLNKVKVGLGKISLQVAVSQILFERKT